MDVALQEFIKRGVEKERMDNPTRVFAFVSTRCHFSKLAVAYLKGMDCPVDIYAVNEDAYVNVDMNVGEPGHLKEFWEEYVDNKCSNWAYPHVFYYKNGWHYVGGYNDLLLKL